MNPATNELRRLDTAGPELGLFVLIPLIFTLLDVFGALFFSGLGHGTPFFSQLFAAPLPSTMEDSWFGALIVWFPLALLMPFRCYAVCRIASALLLSVHYFGVTLLIQKTDWYSVRDVWQKMSPFPSLWVGFYVLTQVLMISLLAHATWRYRPLSQKSRSPLHST